MDGEGRGKGGETQGEGRGGGTTEKALRVRFLWTLWPKISSSNKSKTAAVAHGKKRERERINVLGRG